MIIQNAKNKDFDSIFNLLNQLFPDEKLSKKKVFVLFDKFLKDKNNFMLVLKEKDQVIGFSQVQFRDDFQEQERVGYLSILIVDEVFRGKGFGKKLLAETMKQAKKKGCKEIQFPSTFKREKAHKFYEDSGFHKTAFFFWKEL